jgi:hypothetical protein
VTLAAEYQAEIERQRDRILGAAAIFREVMDGLARAVNANVDQLAKLRTALTAVGPRRVFTVTTDTGETRRVVIW